MTLPGAPAPAGASPAAHLAPGDLGRLSTEAVRPGLDDLDLLDASALVSLIATDARRATDAVVAAAPALSTAVEVSFRSEGRRCTRELAGASSALGGARVKRLVHRPFAKRNNRLRLFDVTSTAVH